MIVARNMWKLWRIGGINLTVETANPERERERERDLSSVNLLPKNFYPLW